MDFLFIHESSLSELFTASFIVGVIFDTLSDQTWWYLLYESTVCYKGSTRFYLIGIEQRWIDEFVLNMFLLTVIVETQSWVGRVEWLTWNKCSVTVRRTLFFAELNHLEFSRTARCSQCIILVRGSACPGTQWRPLIILIGYRNRIWVL